MDNGKRILIGAAGELFVLTGAQKTRKTTLMECIMMSQYSQDKNHTLNFQLVTDGRPTIYYDTEQPRHRTLKNMQRFHTLSGMDKQAKGLYVFSLRGLSGRQMIDFVTHTVDEVMQIEGMAPAFIGIDQIADMAPRGDVNDIEGATEIWNEICYWHEMCENNALIMPAIHTNRGGQNTDGKLGKVLDKKCDGQFRTEMDTATWNTKVIHKEARDARIPTFQFRHDFDGTPRFLGSEEQHGI
jgi:hypothetical protein